MELTSSSLATPRSSGGSSRKHRRKNYNERNTNREVDAIKNPTHLFQKINSGDWEGALAALHDHPVDATVWISRQKHSSGTEHSQNEEGSISWKYLPLHLLCLQKRPPLILLQKLLHIYPHAASMSTPHDGNLPIHYACESGCDSKELLSGVLTALLESYPPSLEVNNFKGKTPLQLCSVKTKKVLMDVMRARKSRVPTSTAHMKNYEQRSDGSLYSTREEMVIQREQYMRPPSKCAHLLPPLMDCDESDGLDEESSVECRQDSTSWQTEIHPAPLNSIEMGLRQQIDTLASQSKSQQQTISQLNDRLKHLASKEEDVVASESKRLCQKILAKAEADSVKFRTQIQQMEAEREKAKEESSRREKMVLETLMSIRDMLTEKGDKMKLTLFDEDTESAFSQDSSAQYNVLSNQLVDALETVFSHIEMDENKLCDQLKMMEEKLSHQEVQYKTCQSINQNLQKDKESLIKNQRSLERSMSKLQDEKTSVDQSLTDLKAKNSSLIVINRSLEQRIGTNQEDVGWKHFQFNDIEDQIKDSALQQTLEENKAQIASLLKEQELLREKNRSLKDTVLMNNEKYLNKVQELGEKYSDLEKVNSDLRARIRKTAMNEKARSSLKVSLEGEDELLYEV